eukprot:7010128-Ditylum_brightwellii.AAC.1
MSHFPSSPKPTKTPALIMGASEDIIYPPELLKKDFDVRFPNATHVIVPDQAHCFVDPGWQNTIVEPLLKWLEVQADTI